MARIAIERSIPYLRGTVEHLGVEVRYLDNEAFVPANIADCDALIVRSITRCNEALLAGTSVRMIATATAGTDHIDAHYCHEAGIRWANAPGCNATAVAQWVVAGLAQLSLGEGWSLIGRTIGIVGVGHVGREVLRLVEPLGMRALLYDPPRAEAEGDEGFASLATILDESDIITLHVPLTRTGRYPTYGLVDDAFVNACARRPVLINACRGGVTQTQALLRGLERGYLSSLLIDCWEGEPRLSLELLEQAYIGTPHIAGFSADGKHRGARMALLAVSDFLGLGAGRQLLEPHELTVPTHSVIDLETFAPSERLRRAMLQTMDPRRADRLLRAAPERFEELRKGYDYPREMCAYTVVGGTLEERTALARMGFALG